MSFAFDVAVNEAKQMARSGDPLGAMKLANKMIEDHPGEVRGWMLRGYLYERQNHHHEAIADLTRAIELDSRETVLWLTRGMNRFYLGDDTLAVEDFTSGLRLCDFFGDDYYRETLHFWRAEALIRLGKHAEARRELSLVAEDFTFWTFTLRTKRDLLKDCER